MLRLRAPMLPTLDLPIEYDMRLGLALDLLPMLAAEGPLISSISTRYQANSANYFQCGSQALGRGSLIVADNVIRHGYPSIDEENSKPAVPRAYAELRSRGSRPVASPPLGLLASTAMTASPSRSLPPILKPGFGRRPLVFREDLRGVLLLFSPLKRPQSPPRSANYR